MTGKPGARALATACALLGSGAPAVAQVAHDAQFWSNTTVFAEIDDLALFAEVQPRFGDGISQLDQILLRPALGWKLSKGHLVYQGYAYVETPGVPGVATTTENRSFQQWNWAIGEVPGGFLSSRARLEQRWLSDGGDTGWRAREMLILTLPLRRGGGRFDLAALGWVETFVNLNTTDWGARSGLDRVRTFVGMQVPLVEKSTIEFGYLNQTVNTPAPGTQTDHILALNLFLRY